MILKEDLIVTLKNTIIKSDKPYDLEMIGRAIDTACVAHDGQRRASGEEYVCHPLQVAQILAEMGMDTDTIVAALLHDVVEDTPMSVAQVQKEFSAEVALLVDGVTKLSNLPYTSREEQQAENVRKMLLAMAQDIRVIIIKLADRLHNMRTSEGWEPQKRRDKAKETMDIYAPLAHRLGIRGVKEELEDLSLRILDPVAYQEIENALASHEHDRQSFLSLITDRLKDKLSEYGFTPHFTGRIKSIPGIYRKMFVQGRDFDEIYDIYAIRVIVDTMNDCYNVLGIVHELFRPIPNRFKDYISTPKANMYQSLHTTVIGKEKIPFEVQIRTWEMHYTAEYGIAAHWKYKVGLQKKDRLEERLSWVRQFIENQKDVDDAEDIVRSIKTDLSTDEVFALTPKGDVITMPTGGTVIDFAYAIHSAVGNRMVGAKVDGRIVPLDYQVKTGEIVEILTTSVQGRGPSRDWLNLVKTSEARSKIRTWFKNECREENIEQGKEAFERELSRNLIHLTEEKMQELLEIQCRKQHFSSVEDFYAAIGYGGVLLSRIMPRVKDDYVRITKDVEPVTPENMVSGKKHHSTGGVVIEGMDNCLVKFARCCNPVPGDDIIGFITRGFGVSIHTRDCINVPKDPKNSPEAGRWVRVSWDIDTNQTFKATILVDAQNRVGLLADLTTQLASMRVMIYAVNVREPDGDAATIHLTIGVNGTEHLSSVVDRLLKVDGIYDIHRGSFS